MLRTDVADHCIVIVADETGLTGRETLTCLKIKIMGIRRVELDSMEREDFAAFLLGF